MALPTIVIDPGHGGRDVGITHADRAEKDINLALARALAARLQQQHRVILTRTGDYFLSAAERVAKANRAGADLYVSLHTGQGGTGAPWRVDLGYLSSSFASQLLASSGPDGDGPLSASGTGRERFRPVFVPWETVHRRHAAASRKAARRACQYLEKEPGLACQVKEERLAILAGATMPAVMIEVEPLFVPPDGTDEAAVRLAEAIARMAAATGPVRP